MIIDKLGQLVKVKDRIAIAELNNNNSLKTSIVLSLATVLYVGNNYLKIKYDLGHFDNYCVNKEFILFTQDNIYSMIENVSFDLVGL